MDDFSSPSYRRTSSSTRRTTPDGKRKAAAHAVERERDSIGKINSDGKSSVNGNDGSSAKQRRRGQSPPRGAHKDKKARSQLMGKQSSKSSSKKRRRALAKQYSSSDIGVARQKTETSSGGKNRRKGGHTRGVVSSDASCKPSSLVDDGQSTMKKPPPPTTTVSSGTTSAIASLFLSEHVSGPHRIGTNRTQKVTTHPGERDVLLGRGRSHREHLGNQFFHHLVAMQRDQYDQLNREDKTELTRHIVRHIREEGGRFLKKDKVIQRWREVTDEEARKKVSHAMRDGRRNSLGDNSTEMIDQGTNDLPPTTGAASTDVTAAPAAAPVESVGANTQQPPPIALPQEGGDLLQKIQSLLGPPAAAGTGITSVEELASSSPVSQMIPGLLSPTSTQLSMSQLQNAALVHYILSSTATTTTTPSDARSIGSAS